MYICIWPGRHLGCMHIYIRGFTGPREYVYIWLGAHPGMHVCVYICVCVCAYGWGPTLAVYMYAQNPQCYIYVYILPSWLPWFSWRVYTQCHRASFTLVWVGVYICTQWREVTLLKIPRFSWLAFHFFEESHVIGKAVGSGHSVRNKIVGTNHVFGCMREWNHPSLIYARAYILMHIHTYSPDVSPGII